MSKKKTQGSVSRRPVSTGKIPAESRYSFLDTLRRTATVQSTTPIVIDLTRLLEEERRDMLTVIFFTSGFKQFCNKSFYTLLTTNESGITTEL
jgi:hypothetical protein